MSYRNYIGSIPKREYNKIKKFTKDEFFEYKKEDVDDGHIGVYDVCSRPYLHELGKYVDEFDKKLYKPVFKNKELQRYFTEEHDFYLVDKPFLEAVINHYRDLIKEYYTKQLKVFTNDIGRAFTIPNKKDLTDEHIDALILNTVHVRDMALEWGVAGWFENSQPYDLSDDSRKEITNSWKYEYVIFQLIYIYRTFDWKRNVMIYYGY